MTDINEISLNEAGLVARKHGCRVVTEEYLEDMTKLVIENQRMRKQLRKLRRPWWRRWV